MESKGAHVHMSHAGPDITGAPEVKRPHIKWKRHRRANSCVLTTERSQGLEPVVSCLAHSPRAERDILLIWATSARRGLFVLEAILHDNVELAGANKGRSHDSAGAGRSQLTKEPLGFCFLAFSPFFSQSVERALARVRPRIPQIDAQSG